MRLILSILLLFNLMLKCQDGSTVTDSTDIIFQFIDEEFTGDKTDKRLFIPPPPPESDDGTWYSGKMKSDSIIKNLKPLTYYIKDSIWFDSSFKPKRELPKGFDFVKTASSGHRPSLALDISSLPERKSIILKSIQLSEFNKILPTIRYQNDYGGLVSFQNLFFSKDGKKAYFEIHLFKGKLNAGTNAIFAEWKNAKWYYTEQFLSIS